MLTVSTSFDDENVCTVWIPYAHINRATIIIYHEIGTSRKPRSMILLFFIQISRYKVKKKKIWHHIDHDGRIKSYLKHYQPALSLSYVLCRVRFLFMFINAFKLLRAAQFVSHTGPFSILRNHLSFIDSLFYQQLGWNCIMLLNMWRSIIGYKSLYQTIVPHFHAEKKTKNNKKKLERGIFYFNFIPLKAGKN